MPTYEEVVAELTAPGAPFELEELEIRGVRVPVFKAAPRTVRDLYDANRAADRIEREFLVYEDERWTYGRALAQADAISASLVARFGVEKGDRVAIGMRNYPEWITSWAGSIGIGAIAVSLNAWWTTEEMDYALGDSSPKVLLVDLERVERVLPGAEKRGIPVVVVRSEGAPLPAGVQRIEDVLVEGATRPEVDLQPDDDATILYTSGTTGQPKGAVSTHRAVVNTIMGFVFVANTNAARAPASDSPRPSLGASPLTGILCVPLFHVTGCIAVNVLSAFVGNRIVMMYKWNPERALELIEREKVNIFTGVPTMSHDLLNSPDYATRDTSSLISVGGGGAPQAPGMVKKIDESFGTARPGIGYGMTETTAASVQNSGDDYLRKPKSTGRPPANLRIRVIDDAGNALPPGERGEICFLSASNIRCYWNKPEATAETIRDGWLRSGDVGYVDEEGFVFIEDRVKDMVLRGGENIYCAEVEAAAYEHPTVQEAAAFGLPDERLGEELAMAVHPKRGQSIAVDALLATMRERLASFKVPTKVFIYGEPLPRGATGKIQKRQIRKERTPNFNGR